MRTEHLSHGAVPTAGTGIVLQEANWLISAQGAGPWYGIGIESVPTGSTAGPGVPGSGTRRERPLHSAPYVV